jgi:hypothetical protein
MIFLSREEHQYDGRGRLILPNLTYTGLGNEVAADGTTVYVRDVADDLVGVASGGNQRYAWTDVHTDVVGEFGATGSTLSGSVSYDPWGKILAGSGMIGKLGYQCVRLRRRCRAHPRRVRRWRHAAG